MKKALIGTTSLLALAAASLVATPAQAAQALGTTSVAEVLAATAAASTATGRTSTSWMPR